ncbi:expressed protein [Arabidopsis lyrata subsp. lyrata]|uniref:Expressed protein n=1 Tax=Arabidopsis lyrata subsp. lyrata TaxID=81972 RepID=D7LYH0_ARALL|nr:expressed protein [Arabidopsis lyrata subsp. lyrata]
MAQRERERRKLTGVERKREREEKEEIGHRQSSRRGLTASLTGICLRLRLWGNTSRFIWFSGFTVIF